MFFLWPPELFSHLPEKYIRCLHRDCCILRKSLLGQSTKKIDFMDLFKYHTQLLLFSRNFVKNFDFDRRWCSKGFTGDCCTPLDESCLWYGAAVHYSRLSHHTLPFLKKCIELLRNRGIDISEETAEKLAALYTQNNADIKWKAGKVVSEPFSGLFENGIVLNNINSTTCTFHITGDTSSYQTGGYPFVQ